MPKNLFQEIIFTIIMVIVMVYAMICYNIALNFPMALCWQLFFAGPAVRFVFSLIFREKKTVAAESEESA